jgi:uncharacterized alpha-E superfamily protein
MGMSDVRKQNDAAAIYRNDFDLDLDNLIEEVESIRRAEPRSVEHHARVVVAQLLQLAHSTLSDPRWSWKSAAMSHRHELETRLTPTLRQELEARLEEVYRRGRKLAATVLDTEGTPCEWLPRECRYTLAEVLDEDWLPTNVYGFDRLET